MYFCSRYCENGASCGIERAPVERNSYTPDSHTLRDACPTETHMHFYQAI